MTGSDRERDVEALSLLLRRAARDYLRLSDGDYWPSLVADAQARAILASDWLAAHDKAVADEVAAEALDQRNEALDRLSDRTRAKWEAEGRYAALVDKVRALADKWAAEDDMTQWGSHDKRACARRLRTLLEADQ